MTACCVQLLCFLSLSILSRVGVPFCWDDPLLMFIAVRVICYTETCNECVMQKKIHANTWFSECLERVYSEAFENSVLREISDILEIIAKTITEWVFRFPPPCGWGLRSSAMLRGVSGLPYGSHFQGSGSPRRMLEPRRSDHWAVPKRR
jgi:hypothetical protein